MPGWSSLLAVERVEPDLESVRVVPVAAGRDIGDGQFDVVEPAQCRHDDPLALLEFNSRASI
jgi:hypothetical protein